MANNTASEYLLSQAETSSIVHRLIESKVVGLSVVTILALVFYKQHFKKIPLPDVPFLRLSKLSGAAGESEDAASYMENGSLVMQAGWEQFSKHGKHFLLRTPDFPMLVLAPQFVEELRSASDDKYSAVLANSEFMQFRHTLHPVIEYDQYQNVVVQKQLTQCLGPRLLDIVDEAKASFKDILGSSKKPRDLKMWDLSFNIVTRTANRLLFGPDLASDKEFLRLSVEFSFILFGGADLIRTYPEFLRSFILWWKTPIRRALGEARTMLMPIIDERLRSMRQHEAAGTVDQWNKQKPDDCIQWVLDVTPMEKRNTKMLVYRMLFINIAAVHTSSVTFLDCLYELAAHTEIHEELREEILKVFGQEDGWTKQGLTHLHKMDSFMREVVRFNPVFCGNIDRLSLKDNRLSDGTLIPKGTFITCPSYPMYMDDEYYENAKTFDAFRFSRLREASGKETAFSFVQTSTTYLHFGHGKHACPGRFFASNEIKILLILVLMNYNVSLPDPSQKPEGVWVAKARMPSTKGVVRWVDRDAVPDSFKIF